MLTMEELREIQQKYEEEILDSVEAPTDSMYLTWKIALDLAHERCYTHAERGQRLWAFGQAYKEVVMGGKE